MTHVEALEVALEAINPGPRHSALVGLCRSLAQKMDGAGTPGDRLLATYLSALRALASGSSEGEPSPRPVSTLSKFRDVNAGKSKH